MGSEIPLGEVNHWLHQRVLVKRKASIIDENRVIGGLNIRGRLSAVKVGKKRSNEQRCACTKSVRCVDKFIINHVHDRCSVGKLP